LLIGTVAGFLHSSESCARAWLRAESPHFVLYSSLGQGETREYLRQLEAFNYIADLILGTDPKSVTGGTKFTIYLFSDRDLLKVVRPTFTDPVAGVYMHCVEGAAAFAFRPAGFDSSSDDDGLTILQHEYAHHVMFSHLRQFYPAWYVEGFAEYLSTVRVRRGGTFIIGRASQMRIGALSDERWLDFRVLLDPAAYSEAVKANRVGVGPFYAQSWLLTHYMLADTGRVRAFKDYFDRIGRGEEGNASFESATGMPVGHLRGTLENYMRSMKALEVRVPEIPESSLQVISLPEERSEYLLTAAVVRTCPERDYGGKLADQLRAMAPRHSRDNAFHLEMDRAELLFGDTLAARADLDRMVAEGEDGFDLHYLLGRTFYAAATKETERAQSRMSDAAGEFLTAYKLDRLDAPNLYFLSRSLDSGQVSPTKGVINASSAATSLAPSIREYAVYAAIVSLRAGNPEKAISALQPFACDPHDPKGAAGFTAAITAIKDGKALPEIIAAMQPH
jgi:hypothetical protein